MLNIPGFLFKKIYKVHANQVLLKINSNFNFIQLKAKATDTDYLDVISSSANAYSAASMNFKALGDEGIYILPPLDSATVKSVVAATIKRDDVAPEFWELILESDQGKKSIYYAKTNPGALPDLEHFVPYAGKEHFEVIIGAEQLNNLIKSVPKKAPLKFSFYGSTRVFLIEVLESETKTKFAICPLRDSRFKGV